MSWWIFKYLQWILKEAFNHVNDDKTEDVTEDVCDDVRDDIIDDKIDVPTQCSPDLYSEMGSLILIHLLEACDVWNLETRWREVEQFKDFLKASSSSG